jgi:transcriptional regulator with XRE-family HTH domain
MTFAIRLHVMTPQAFGPNLRRLRLQRGISLETLTARTNVNIELWEAMERNDFSRWPTGVAARAYIRDYAAILGLDRDETVDEFCRVTSHGDRRGYRLLRETAAVLGHELVWRDDLPEGVADGDRRAAPAPQDPSESGAWFYANLRRLVAGFDLILVLVLATGIAGGFRISWWATLSVIALLYYGLSQVFLGSSPTVWAIVAYVSARRPLDRPRVMSVFRGLDLMSGKNPAPDRRATD